MVVPYHVSCGPLERRTPALFEPTRDESWPVDLDFAEQHLTLPRGVPNRVNIAVTNSTKHDVVLSRRTPLGNLKLISSWRSVTPLEVVRKDANPSEKETDRLENEQSSKSPQKRNDQKRDETPLKTPLVKLGNLTES